MRLLLMSGLGPEFLNSKALDGTLLAPDPSSTADAYRRLAGRPIDLRRFTYGEGRHPLLRSSRGKVPHLPTASVRSILDETGVDYEWFDLEDLWSCSGREPSGDFDVVALSTSFIWDQATFRLVLDWIRQRYPGAVLIAGGQYSTFKCADLLAEYHTIDYIIRGDAEIALPMLLRALKGRADLRDVPNLAFRDDTGALHMAPLSYIDIETYPSPAFHGRHDLVPYESMRGCPFTCKFCSYPAASPKWRYKSADKIVRDWSGYAEKNGAQVIKSMDSTFTIPPPRFRQLLDVLPQVGVAWEAYSRANVLDSREVVQRLEAAHCRYLFIGFESMNETSLRNMNKKVSVAQNHRAVAALRGTSIDVRASFLVGYPGETPEAYAETHRFIVEQFRGRFNVHFFILNDETMPVWQDAPRFDLEVESPITWKHCGMDSRTAEALRAQTLFETRWKNEHAVHELWQPRYQRPLVPDVDLQTNYRIEKLVEQLAYLAKDLGTGDAVAARCRAILDELRELGVRESDEPSLPRESPLDEGNVVSIAI
jgi:anaerobic magnesium-protoporphyrin IX monomethyl ester cyclase